MAEQQQQQRQQSSSSVSGGHRSGCMWGLHILDFHRLFQMRKLLFYGKHRNGTKSLKIKSRGHSNSQDRDFLQSNLLEDNVSATDRNAAKAHVMSKKRSRERDKKHQISPFASRLLRTISIHRSESNDYDVPSHLISDGETSTVGWHASNPSSSTEDLPLLHTDPDESTFGKPCEVCGTLTSSSMDLNRFDELGNHLLGQQLLLKEKLTEAKDAMLKEKITEEQIGNISHNQSKLLSDMLELFNGNRELFLKILQDPSFGLVNYLETQVGTSSDVILTKSNSFPGARFKYRQDGQSFEPVHKKNRSEHESLTHQDEKPQTRRLPSVSNVDDDGAHAPEPAATAAAGIAVRQSTTLNTNIVNDFEFLPGSPSKLKYRRNNGRALNRFKDIKKRIKDVIKENRKEKHRISMDGILHKIPFGHKLSKGMQNESSRNKFLRSKYSDKGITRSYSLTESLDRYTHLLDISSSKENKRASGRLMSMQQNDDLQCTNFPRTLRRISSLPELQSYFWSKGDQSEERDTTLLEKIPTMDVRDDVPAVETLDFDEPKLIHNLVHMEESLGSDSHVEHSTGINDRKAVCEDQQQLRLINEQKQCQTCIISDDFIAEGGTDYSVSEESKMKTTSIHFKEIDSLKIPPSQLVGVDVFNVDHTVDVSRGTADTDTSKLQVDQRDEAKFNLVRKMLKQSKFNSENLYKEWYQKYPAEDSLLDSVDGEHEVSPDQQLLFDLINEVLLEIYDDCHAYHPRFSRHDSRFRTVPVGHHLLEEVWTRIRWHMISHAHHDPTTESLVGRDFAKHDGWMDLQFDTEHIDLDLEDMILDDLVNEVLLQFCDS